MREVSGWVECDKQKNSSLVKCEFASFEAGNARQLELSRRQASKTRVA